MKNIGGKVVVAFALVVGLVTAYLVYHYVNGVQQQAKPIPMSQVVTAAREIPARTVVTTDMLRLAQVPASTKLPLALVDPSQATGKVSKEPISTGEQVLTNKLFGDRVESGLAFVVPPGKRAVAVGVNEVVGSGGLIEPGDNVDVVAVVDLKPPPTNQQGASASPQPTATPAILNVEAAAQYILQNVEVLAVAQTLEGDTPAPKNGANPLAPVKSQPPQPAAQQPSAQPQAHTVTLAVAPDEAARLILAEEKGHIRLVLRAHGDDSGIKMPDDPLFTSLPGEAIQRPTLQQGKS